MKIYYFLIIITFFISMSNEGKSLEKLNNNFNNVSGSNSILLWKSESLLEKKEEYQSSWETQKYDLRLSPFPTQKNPFLYKIRMNDKQFFYLWGSNHCFPLQATLSGKRLKKLFDQSKALVTEINDIQENSDSVTLQELIENDFFISDKNRENIIEKSVESYKNNIITLLVKDNPEIWDQQSQKEYIDKYRKEVETSIDWYSCLSVDKQEQIQKFFNQTSTLKDCFNNLHPAVALYIIGFYISGSIQLNQSKFGMDNVLYSWFVQEKENPLTFSLETYTDRIRLGGFKAIKIDRETRDHMEALSILKGVNIERNIESASPMTFKYQDQLEYFEAKIEPWKKNTQIGVNERTQFWIQKSIPKIMNNIEFPFIMMVGNNHVVGENGLLNWMLNQGWRVEQLQNETWTKILLQDIPKIEEDSDDTYV